jgi:hypothetical protein
MGDRAVIGFKGKRDDTPIWLYTHWSGYARYGELAKAISDAQPRWTDESYATRIAVSTIVGSNWASELGFGLTTNPDIIEAGEYADVPVVIWDEAAIDIMMFGEVIATLDFEAFLEEVDLLGNGDFINGGVEFTKKLPSESLL